MLFDSQNLGSVVHFFRSLSIKQLSEEFKALLFAKRSVLLEVVDDDFVLLLRPRVCIRLDHLSLLLTFVLLLELDAIRYVREFHSPHA